MICNCPLGLLTFPANDSASCLHLHEGPTYIGYTERLLRERIAEHGKNGNTEVSEHLRECGGDINQESFEILYKINKNKGLMHLRTAEALLIRSNKPSRNNKDVLL